MAKRSPSKKDPPAGGQTSSGSVVVRSRYWDEVLALVPSLEEGLARAAEQAKSLFPAGRSHIAAYIDEFHTVLEAFAKMAWKPDAAAKVLDCFFRSPWQCPNLCSSGFVHMMRMILRLCLTVLT